MSLKDKIVRALALRALRGKVEDLRGKESESGMGKALKFLDGWKLMIGVAILFFVKWWDAAHNGHAGDIVGAVLTVLGWMPAADWTAQVREAVPSLVILIGFAGKLWKAQQQARAGASASELLTTEGYVKHYIAARGVTDSMRAEDAAAATNPRG